MKLKPTKKILILMLSVSMLSACNGQNDNVVKDNQQTAIKNSVKKNESVNLPVNIYKDSDYNIEGQKVTFFRNIINVEMKDFDESSELDFLERYDNYVRNENFNLKDDFKLLVINMKHEINEKARRNPYDGFLLNKGSGLVIGDTELASENEFLKYQQTYIATDYRVKETSEEKGDVLLAIPNEYAKDKNLQLKIVQKIDGANKIVYIDLN